jgi:uncharacterized Tic20 family protein
VLRADRVQNLMNDFTKHNAHNRQNIEIDNYVDFVLVVFVISVRIMFFVVVVISFAFVVSIVFAFVELILEIELLTIFARRVKLLVADDTHFDDDNDDVLNFELRA